MHVQEGDIITGIVDRLPAAVNLGISVYFTCNIVRHISRPGNNIGYTRMLMFAFLSTIPFVFILGFAGGRDRWPYLLNIAREIAGPEWYASFIIAGLGAVTILLPLGIFVAIFFVMEFRSAFLFVLFFIPVLLRLFLSTKQECIMSAVLLAMLFLFMGPIGFVAVLLLKRHGKTALAQQYGRHMRKIWLDQNEDTSPNMFMAACLFALSVQLIEIIRTARAMVVGWGW
ncbi:MAG TPA: hypothetical protein PK573_16900 [Spirochaetota bacterium]|jgi:hypothetical protein|nr:hypothetical protein [Spirochaetota bacterium]